MSLYNYMRINVNLLGIATTYMKYRTLITEINSTDTTGQVLVGTIYGKGMVFLQITGAKALLFGVNNQQNNHEDPAT